ncbi:uncharacterized protein N7479_000523 [Penicillium vulpinum]|uniref:Myb-like domain-containing protein n=1 Tax=Penicillium vulpinum TaxID=29845 RepID=A0A1V6S5F1_9EURO|nr:uncharacterized protein N7479_000523 [Penicillium vulpinum]KAJ5970605.1 hypothetical protein N7479_000523 [Penicillium vulpinum]OQE09265.1 hypothetical protein PENVUL_c007G05355 [Penicillium vulpinum]
MAHITGSRMTRSRSRELNSGFMPNKGLLERNWLSGLAEEPSTPSPGFIVPRDVIPESPENHEGHTNVSGTTLGHNDVEPVDSQVADKTATHLPFVQQQATLVMTLVVRPDLNPDSLAAESKKLVDPNHPNHKRLRRSVEGLADELEDSPLSRDGKSFLDISQARRLLSSAQFDASIADIHMTNCTLLTLNMLLPSMGIESQSEVIQQLDAQFPACVMSNLAESSMSRQIGASNSTETTFNLALGIRTQFFIMELERRQHEQDFNPVSILRQVFAMDLVSSEDDSQNIPSSFRGFNLPGVLQDEDGHLPEHLPEKFLLAVSDRFNELHEELSEWDSVDIDGLKKAYRWRSFERDLARWIYARDREIKDDIRRLSEKAHNSPAIRRLTSVPTGTPSRRQVSTVTPSAEISRRGPLPQQTQSPQKERLMAMAPQVDKIPENTASPSGTTPQKLPEQSAPGQVAQPTAKDPSRRKSKGNFRDPASFAALMRRQATSHQQSLSNLESQARNISTNTSIVAQGINPGSSIGLRAEPPEIQESPERRYTDIGDDSTYVNNDEELDLGRGPETDVMTSTSPPTSSRISRVSHNPHPSRFFDSPKDENTQRSIPVARRFLDKQKNAGVVSPISQYDGPSAGTVLGKRNRNADILDDDSSDGSDIEFEQNNQEVDPRRRIEKPQQTRPAAKRQRPEDTAGSPSERLQASINTSVHNSNSTQVSQRAQTADSDEATDEETTAEQLKPPSSTQSRWEASNIQAATINRRSTPRTSHRWTEEEDQRLISLMGIFGTAFATIKKQDNACPASEGGPLLERRSQVNCKDRARNLKRKYLREGRPLPPNLEKATN